MTDRKLSWKAELGWALVILGVLERILSWLGTIDFLVTRSTDPGWIGTLIASLAQYSAIWGSAAILAGFFLIIRNERRIADERYVGREQLRNEIDIYVGRQVQNSLNPGELVLEGDGIDDSAASRSALYCYAPTVSLSELPNSLRFEIAIIAFNGYESGAALRRVRGQIVLRGQTAQEQVELRLQTPSVIPGRSPEIYEPRSEFMVVLFQAVTPAELQTIEDLLNGGAATFDMRELEIEIELDSEPPRTEHLAITRSPNARRTASGDYLYNHTIFLNVGVAVG